MRELPEPRDEQQYREDERVERLALLVGARDEVRDVVGKRLQRAVRGSARLQLEAGVAELLDELGRAVAGANMTGDIEVDPATEHQPAPLVARDVHDEPAAGVQCAPQTVHRLDVVFDVLEVVDADHEVELFIEVELRDVADRKATVSYS